MVMPIGLGDRETDRHEIEEGRFGRGLGAAEIGSHVKDKLVGARMKGVAAQQRRIGASVGIGAGPRDPAPRLALDGEQFDFDPVRRVGLALYRGRGWITGPWMLLENADSRRPPPLYRNGFLLKKPESGPFANARAALGCRPLPASSDCMIDPQISEWISQLLRWVHVITAIAWIGSSFYFIHLDLSLKKRDGLPPGVGGEAWQVHGGGFYNMRKYLIAPPELPKELTWFKWESYSTWITGFFLLVWVYYLQADLYTIDPAIRVLAPWQAGALGIGALVLSWLVYEGLCRSPARPEPGSPRRRAVRLYSRRRLCVHASVQRARGVSAHGGDDRHLDVGERLLRHHPQSEKGRGDAAGGTGFPIPPWAFRPSSARRTTTT